MAFAYNPIAAFDSAGDPIPGGLLAGDQDDGVGPQFLIHGIVDAIDGANYAAVDSSNRLTVLADLGSVDNSVLDSMLATLGTIDADTSTLSGAVSSSKMATKAASGDFADGALATLGAKADAANPATDTTAISAQSVLKQISASVQALEAGVADSAAYVAQPGSPIMGYAEDSPTPLTDGDLGFPSLEPGTRNLRVTPPHGSGKAVSITRTADTNAYVANDAIGTGVSSGDAVHTFSNLRPDGAGEYLVTSAELEIDLSAVPSGMTSFNLHLHSASPNSDLADNAAYDLTSGDRSTYLGKINLGTPVDEGSTLYIKQDGINQQITLAGTDLFAYLVTVGAYTPASATVYKVTLHGIPL